CEEGQEGGAEEEGGREESPDGQEGQEVRSQEKEVTGRREVIVAGVAALASASALAPGEFSSDSQKKKKDKDEPKPPAAPLVTKAIPSTGERLAVIGVGTNNYSPTTSEERAARREVLAGLTAAGASVIDTAPAYRQSEEVIGDLLADIGN